MGERLHKSVGFSCSKRLKQSRKCKNTQIFITFIINHENTLIKYEIFAWVAVVTNQRIRENIHPPCQVAHEDFSRRLRVTFKLF